MKTKQTYEILKNIFKAFVIGVILISFAVISCEDETKDGDAPPLPPEESFIILCAA